MLGAWSFLAKSRLLRQITNAGALSKLLKQTSTEVARRVDVVDAHYLTNHTGSFADRVPADVGLCPGWLGLFPRRRIVGADCSDITPLASLARYAQIPVNGYRLFGIRE